MSFLQFPGLQLNMLYQVEINDNWRGMWNIILEHILIVQNVETRQILSSTETFNKINEFSAV